jgi:hypothetical protein
LQHALDAVGEQHGVDGVFGRALRITVVVPGKGVRDCRFLAVYIDLIVLLLVLPCAYFSCQVWIIN